MVLDTINKFIEERRKKKAGKIVEQGMLDSYRESEEIRKAEQMKKEADRLVHLKQYKAAIHEYQAVLDLYPYMITDELFQKPADFLFIVYTNIGTAYFFLNEFKEALEFLDKALAIEKATPELKVKALVGKGNCFYKAKKFITHAKEKHAKEITLEHDFEKHEKIIEQMKRIDEKENLLKKALECYTKASEIEKNDADLFYKKGHMEFLLGMVKEAISSFDHVLELQEQYENKETLDLFDEIKREKGLKILEKKERAYKTKTGHYVKNKAEMLIANFLFDNNLLFQYNSSITWTNFPMQASFYIPQLELYIEHIKHNHEEIQIKLSEYKKHNKRVVWTNADDELQLEDILKIKMKPFIDL